MKSLDRLAAMPDWPFRLSEDQAALALGVSKSTFRDRWAKKKTYPQPVKEDGRLFWHREQLRRFVDAQFGITQSSGRAGGDDTWADLD